MKITRVGSEKNHGAKAVKLENPRFTWDSDNNCITIKKSGVTDFLGVSKHDYNISVSLGELAEMLDLVSEEPSVDSPGAISVALAKSLKSLIRLTTVIAGGTVLRSPE
jgi:hypothetical protein